MNYLICFLAAAAVAIILVWCLARPGKKVEGFGPSEPPPSVGNWGRYPVVAALTSVMAPLMAPNSSSLSYPVNMSGSVATSNPGIDINYYIDMQLTKASFNSLNFDTSPTWTTATATNPLPNPTAVAEVVVPISGTVNISYTGQITSLLTSTGQSCTLFSSTGSSMTLAYTGILVIEFYGGSYDAGASVFTYQTLASAGINNNVDLWDMVNVPGNTAVNAQSCYSDNFSGLMELPINEFLNQCVALSPVPASPFSVYMPTPPPYPQCYTDSDCSATEWLCVNGVCVL